MYYSHVKKVQDNVKLEKKKKSLQMQVLWHTMKERGKAFTKPPAVPMCPRSRGQMNRGDYLYHWLREEKEKKKDVC